jgi:hypothetical protein
MAGQKYNKAYEAYQQTVYRDGRNPTCWCSIGVLYFQINQFRDALDTVEDGTFTWTIGLGWGSAILGAPYAIYLHSSPLTDLRQPSFTQEYLRCAMQPWLPLPNILMSDSCQDQPQPAPEVQNPTPLPTPAHFPKPIASLMRTRTHTPVLPSHLRQGSLPTNCPSTRNRHQCQCRPTSSLSPPTCTRTLPVLQQPPLS